ncbi:MAG: hypothetical protein ACJ8DC_11355 [Gemmatimonadales bacterium]
MRHQFGPASMLALLASAWACGGGDIAAPSSSTVVLTTSTSGTEPDRDGYSVSLDGVGRKPIGINGHLVLSDLAPGDHLIGLDGVAANCTSTGHNPRSVTVAEGDTTALTFLVTCSATMGTLGVTTNTSGLTPDPDGYTLTVDAGAPQPIADSAVITLSGLAVGAHQVTLSGVAPNCTIMGINPRQVNVVGSIKLTIAFHVDCAGTGVVVSVASTGPDPDPDGYLLTVDGGASQAIAVGATLQLVLDPGPHSLRLTGLAQNCSASGDDPRPVRVPLGEMIPEVFQVTCRSLVSLPAQLLVWGGPGTHILKTDGSRVVDLTPDSHGRSARWSPDRRKIVFVSGSDILVMEADGSHVSAITRGDHPSWSPDGTRIVFEAAGGLSTMDADGSRITPLTSDYSDATPVWSPDGTRIAFSRRSRTVCRVLPFFDVVCAEDIYAIATDGTGLVNLTNNGSVNLVGWAREPAWSPDGSKIAYTLTHFLIDSEIYVMRADGSGPIALTNTSGIDEQSAVWSPDASLLAIARRDSSGRIRMATIPTGGGAATVRDDLPDPAYPSSWR